MIAALRRQGSLPVRAEPAGRRAGSPACSALEFGRGDALSRTDLTDVTRELAVMLGAGQDLDRALRFLVDTAPSKRVARDLPQMRDAVRDGSPLAAALGSQPRSAFRACMSAWCAPGRPGGTLAATLERLADAAGAAARAASTVTSALIYPAILLVGGIGSIVLLLTQVLPQFVPLFEQAGAACRARRRS